MTRTTARKMSRAERLPLDVLIDFAELTRIIPPGPFGFMMQCIPPHLKDAELELLEARAYDIISHVASEKAKRKRRSKGRPGGNVVPFKRRV